MSWKHIGYLACGIVAAAGLYSAAGADARPGGRAHTEQRAAAGAGALLAMDAGGQPGAACPLEHTDVRLEVSGFLSRVYVTQRFKNPFDEAIEAVYTFPLSEDSVVDDMTIRVGERTVKGKVKEMAGKITNNRILTVDGKAGQVTSQIQDKVGEVKKVFGK